MEKANFIEEVINRWTKNDLAGMRDAIRPISGESGNINFPLALCTLAYMEFIGGFLWGEDRGFACNVMRYIDDCFTSRKEYPIDILTDLFRNGLVHEYFPRGGVSRNGKRPAIYKGNKYNIVLDAETLVTDFFNSLGIFINKLETTKYEKRMDQAIGRISSLKNKYKDLIEKLSRQPNDDETATPSEAPPEETTGRTFSAGASGSLGPMHNTTDPSLLGNES